MRFNFTKKHLVLFSLLIVGPFSFSQQNIKSILIRPLDANNFSTTLPLGSPFELSFDDLEADEKDYFYKIEHMTYDWKPSAIFPNEYINGFQENIISTIENSFNTLQNYTNYRVQFPNNNTVITKSGNYKISVLDSNNESVFSRRITLYENKTIVGIQVLRTRNTLMTDHKQTVQFTINYSPNQIKNPSQELKVALLQNNNWNTVITNLNPQFFKRNQLVYNYHNKTNFWSGNEYLHFDNKQLRNSTLQIKSVTQKNLYHSYLYTQERRKFSPYTYSPDINGQFVIRTTEGSTPYTEADYAVVHFSLESEKIKNKKLYVYGAFNNFELTPENQLHYNKTKKTYQTTIVLKQGFYNYTFATKEDSDSQINLHEINGSFFQTENEYKVIVYQKSFGSNYYKAIGVGIGVTNPQE